MTGAVRASAAVAAAADALRRGDPIGLVGPDAGPRAVALPAGAATPAWVRDAQRASGAPLRVIVSAALARRLELGSARPGPAGEQRVDATISVDLGDRPGSRAPATLVRLLRTIADPAATATALVRPGQLFPSAVPTAGVLADPALEAAAHDVAGAARMPAALAFCALPARRRGVDAPAQRRLAARVRIWVELTAVIEWQLARTAVSSDSGWTRLPTPHGVLQVRGYGSDHLAGDRLLIAASGAQALAAVADESVSVHDECLLAAAGFAGCDCQARLGDDLARLGAGRPAVIVYRKRPGGLIGHDDADLGAVEWARECGVLAALVGVVALARSPEPPSPVTTGDEEFGSPTADPSEHRPQ